MPISIPTLLSYLLIIGSARAQVGAPNCSDSSFAWSYNSLHQNPCWVAAYLSAVCNNGTFILTSLLPQHYYTGPNGVDDGDSCKCNTVVYNLISACDACQGEPWIPFPEPVPNSTRVPQWAYIDSSISDNWNISTAQLAGINPEVTGTASIFPTSTSTAAKSTSTSHHSSNAGAIAGGVVGGIICAVLIAGVIVWFTIRHRRARSSPYLDSQGSEKEQSRPHPLADGAPKLYDPLDPSTYPSKEYLPVANQPLGPTGFLQPIDGRYSGLPEI
ncbi:hypothetical protein H4582DRAFT_2052238 [Lactarius indigo]|nr:hypothetical protein H4582DRAFT_2052238 [Lactarius indigo]